MTTAQLRRLEAITEAVQWDGDAMALLGLGSSGEAAYRMDEHSDLDFFLIVAEGHKSRFLANLSWLDANPRWVHRNTADGYQVLCADGVFCEFAVFEPHELASIAFEPGRVLWSRAGFDAAVLESQLPTSPDPGWLADQILANLFVGLHRHLRGEELAAQRMIQGEALDNLLRIAGIDDPFNPSRRAERHQLPLARMAAGYCNVPESAAAIFESLPARARSSELGSEISQLLDRCRPGSRG